MGENGNIRFLEPAEVQAILEAPSLRSLTGLRNRCIMGIMYEAGLRISEALALKPRDVSLEDKRVEVLRWADTVPGPSTTGPTTWLFCSSGGRPGGPRATTCSRWSRGPAKAATFPPGRSDGPSGSTSSWPAWTPGP